MATLKKFLVTCRKFFGHNRIVLLIGALMATPAFSQQEQESVVLVHTKPESGYGVAWDKPDNIVTALHLVAGKSLILVQWKGKKANATIVKINKNADLALLKLATPLGIPPLQVHQGDPPLDSPVDFWEAPKGLARMDRKETRLDAEAKAIPLQKFDNRLTDPKQLAVFKKALCADGAANYPALNQSVFKFEERNIRKSHSGSPITYNGKIIGMVDGGQAIGGKACVWAIPAAGNFQSLLTSTSPSPKQTCSTQQLYGGLRDDNPLLQEGEEFENLADTLAYYEANPYKFTDDSKDQLAMDLEYFAPFREIFETMLEEDQQYVRDLLSDESDYEEPVNLDELLDEPIKIFQEEETGATIAIPANSYFTIEKSPDNLHTLVEVTGLDAGVEMVIFVQHTNSKAEAQAAQKWFESYIVSDGRKWVQETGEEADEDIVDDELLNDPDEPYYNELMDRVVYGDGDEIVAELYASLTIDENNFLGVAVVVDDWHNLSKEQRLLYYFMEACTILSDFAYY